LLVPIQKPFRSQTFRRIVAAMMQKTKPATTTTQLSPLDLRRKIAVREAAELNGVSEATFRRHYRHLIRKVSARRDVVELGDALNLPAKVI
jgi:hypothetical protein